MVSMGFRDEKRGILCDCTPGVASSAILPESRKKEKRYVG